MSVNTLIGKPISLITSYTPDRSSTIALPNPDIFSLEDAISEYPNLRWFVFRITWSQYDPENDKETKHTRYVNWRGQYTSGNTSVLSIPSHLGESLEIPRATPVVLQLVIPPKPSDFLSITPVSEQDYEIVEANKGYIMDNLLTQLCVVNLHHTLSIWVRGSIVKFTPSLPSSSSDNNNNDRLPYVLLAPNTSIEIVTKTWEKKTATEKKNIKKGKESPSFPTLLVRIVPLSSIDLVPLGLHTKKYIHNNPALLCNKNKGGSSSGNKKGNDEVSLVDICQPIEPLIQDNVIYVSKDVFTHLGYTLSTILPIGVLRTYRHAVPPPVSTSVDPLDNPLTQYVGPNKDPLYEWLLPDPTPNVTMANHVLTVQRIVIHPLLTGYTVALHSSQRHALLLPSYSALYISPYHPYLGEFVTPSSLCKMQDFLKGFSNNRLYNALSHLHNNSDSTSTSDKITPEKSIITISHIPKPSTQRLIEKAEKDAISNGTNTVILDPKKLKFSLALSIERQSNNPHDYSHSSIRPALMVRHINFLPSTLIGDPSETLQIPQTWVQLSFYMYLSNYYSQHNVENNNDNKDNENDNGVFTLFGPNMTLTIPLYCNTVTLEEEQADKRKTGSSFITRQRPFETPLFSYQQVSAYCYKKINTLSKTRPMSGYNGYYPHHQQKASAECPLTDDDDEEEDNGATPEEIQLSHDISYNPNDPHHSMTSVSKHTNIKKPKNVDLASLYWKTGTYITIMVAPSQQRSPKWSPLISCVQIHQIKHNKQMICKDYIQHKELYSDKIHHLNNIQIQKAISMNNIIDDAEIDDYHSEEKKQDDGDDDMSTTTTATTTSSSSIPALKYTSENNEPNSVVISRRQQVVNRKMATTATNTTRPIYTLFITCSEMTPGAIHPVHLPTQPYFTSHTQLYDPISSTIEQLPSRLSTYDYQENKYRYHDSDIDQDDDNSQLAHHTFDMKIVDNDNDDEDHDGYNSNDDEPYDDYDAEDYEEEYQYWLTYGGPKPQMPKSLKDKLKKQKQQEQQDNNTTTNGNNNTSGGHISLVDKNKIQIFSQRYQVTQVMNIIVDTSFALPHLTLDTWQSYCPPSPGDSEEAGSTAASTKRGPGNQKDGQNDGKDNKNEQKNNDDDDEEEDGDDDSIPFTDEQIDLMYQMPYALKESHLDTIQTQLDHIINIYHQYMDRCDIAQEDEEKRIAAQTKALNTPLNTTIPLNTTTTTTTSTTSTTSTTEDVSSNKKYKTLYDVYNYNAFPLSQEVFSRALHNPAVLSIPTSPLSGKAYLEALTTSTHTNGQPIKMSAISICSPVPHHFYAWLDKYPFSSSIRQAFSLVISSLSMLRPFMDKYIDNISDYVTSPSPSDTLQVYVPSASSIDKHDNTINTTISSIKQSNIMKTQSGSHTLQQNLQHQHTQYLPLPITGRINTIKTHSIIYGPSKSGKTTTACYLANQLTLHPRINAFAIYLDLSTLTNASVQLVTAIFAHILIIPSLKHRMVVFVLDNIDSILKVPHDHEDSSLNDAIRPLLLNMLNGQIHHPKPYPFYIIATSKTKEELHTQITSSTLFDNSITLEPPNDIQRQYIITSQLNSLSLNISSLTIKNTLKDRYLRTLSDSILNQISIATEGYTYSDITLLVHKIANKMILTQQQKQIANKSSYPTPWYIRDITLPIITSLTSSYVPLPLRGIGLSSRKGGTGNSATSLDSYKWHDIGGLNKVIQTMRQTFEYPIVYPALFSNSPLKLISGILLYGAPGSGKSLLATALQYSTPKLHFIKVKGPEVLDKYVGASEDNVRKIFASARAAKPCVIFFDDFDSIALKRGSDSNGVTDRVVNQLLVEMDGVKGREGVFVLAATTRPDLIDSALLRPGRLDLSLHCSLPNTIQEREDVLRSVCGCNIWYAPHMKQAEITLDNDKDNTTTTTTSSSSASVPTTVTDSSTTKSASTEQDDKDHSVASTANADDDNDNTSTPNNNNNNNDDDIDNYIPTLTTAPSKIINKSIIMPSNIKIDEIYHYNTVSVIRQLYESSSYNIIDPITGTKPPKYKHKYPFVMSDNIDFTAIAKLCKSFTGSDMSALITNALLVATRVDDDDDDDDEYDNDNNTKQENNNKDDNNQSSSSVPQCEFLYNLPIITQEHMLEAYEMTPLSLPISDRNKYQQGYKRFIQDKDGADGLQAFDPKKATRSAVV